MMHRPASRRTLAVLALCLCLSSGIALVSCGKYGPPVRPEAPEHSP